MQLLHLRHNDIDIDRWNNCVSRAQNSFIYAYSWYLDAVSPGWEALVSDDYKYIMPLPVKRKLSIPYIVHPPLTQQLGVFSAEIVTEKTLCQFIRKIPYISYDINLNEKNNLTEATPQVNYILDLYRDYAEISAGYSDNTRRNLAKARKNNLTVQDDLSLPDFLNFYHDPANKHQSEVNQNFVNKLLITIFEQGLLKIYGAYNAGKLVSVLCLTNDKKRLVYLLPKSSEEGKNTYAMFLIVDHIIRQYALQDIVFDFEGSAVEGIARFYKGFGAIDRPYYKIKRWSILSLLNKLNRK